MSKNGLASVAEVSGWIQSGRVLLLAGDESRLAQLPAGQWIGGTSANFMTATGGVTDGERLFYTDITDHATKAEVRAYAADDLPHIGTNHPANGFTVIIVPGLSDVLEVFARDVQGYAGVFNMPLVGWVSGVDVAAIGSRTPKVFAGNATALADQAAVIHVTLPEGAKAHLDIVNVFKQGGGPEIEFDVEGFASHGTCRIGGVAANLAAYIKEHAIDTQLPLVADYHGAMINVSIESVDAETGTVRFLAPVFRDTRYRFAAPIGSYTELFTHALPTSGVATVAFSCNCILNFMYAGLEGKTTPPFTGPFTFGEVAYMLLNQTLVYLSITRLG